MAHFGSTITIVIFALGLALGAVLIWLRANRIVKQAEIKANQLVKEAEEAYHDLEYEIKAELEAYASELQDSFDIESKEFEKRIDELNRKVELKDELLTEKLVPLHDDFQKASSWLGQYKKRVEELEAQFAKKKETLNHRQKELITQLAAKSNTTPDEAINVVSAYLIDQEQIRISQSKGEREDRSLRDAEREAKKIINIVLNRFARPYCSERGIGFVHVESAAAKDMLFGPNRSHLELIEKTCGVDIVFNEEYLSLGVSGFDPVRREWARATLERLALDHRVDLQRVEQILKRSKSELFKIIARDGRKIANELKITGMHTEVMNMLGALRYRYSFAQNQFFHCAEVGHLCGLLSAELGLATADGRRTGVLHDIGKAMDHSIDGGHAVIGADFISKFGEAPHIVHAVRAHHYDETPSTELAFLVIAADAISGARPGARRSTVDSYMQKMGQLEEIGSSFEGVESTYILSAGREIRVIVDSHKVDDLKAVDLSRKIARKIEEDVSYPGLIKVTVVRQTQAVQIAK